MKKKSNKCEEKSVEKIKLEHLGFVLVVLVYV